MPKLCLILDLNPETHIILAQKLFKWLMVLFVGELPPETEYLVWDLFMVKGSVVLFRVALTILYMMQELMMQDDSLENVMLVLQTFCPTVTSRVLLKNLSRDVDGDEINQLRMIYREQVISGLQTEMSQVTKKLFPRV